MNFSGNYSSSNINTYNTYKFTHASHAGKIRKQNEDSLGIFRTNVGLLIIICDGLGGGLAGEFASKSSIEKIYLSFQNSEEPDILLRIKTAINNANRFVYEKSNDNLNFKGMATTCEVFLLNGFSAYWGHIGDSRIYSLKNGKLNQLTKDHSIIQKLVDEGGIPISKSKNHPKKNVITKAIGDEQKPEIDLSKMLLSDGKPLRFFICTDGVTCVVNDEELNKILSIPDINVSSENLISLINDRGAPDNFSFVLISN